MTTAELIQQLRELPPETDIQLVFEFGNRQFQIGKFDSIKPDLRNDLVEIYVSVDVDA